MRQIFLFLFLITVVGWSCNGGDTTPTEEAQDNAPTTPETPTLLSLSTEAPRLALALGTDDQATLEGFIEPGPGFYIIAPSAGVYPDYVHFRNWNEFQKTLSLKHPFLNSYKTWVTALSQEKAAFFKAKETSLPAGTDYDVCNFKEEGIHVFDQEIPYNGLSLVRENLKELGVEETISETEEQDILQAEKDISKEVLIGIRGSEEIYAEGLYFRQKDGRWYLSVMDLRDCAL